MPASASAQEYGPAPASPNEVGASTWPRSEPANPSGSRCAATDTTKPAVEATAAQVVDDTAAVQRPSKSAVSIRTGDATGSSPIGARRIGSPAYASTAWEITHRLQDTGAFAIVEADVPVGAFDPRMNAAGIFDSGDCRANTASEDPGWALDTIGWSAALALMDPAVRGGTGIRVGHPDSGFTDHYALGSPVDQASDWDVIDNDDDATDPLRPPRPLFSNPLPNPGHGTSTASIILGRGDGARFSGVAPRQRSFRSAPPRAWYRSSTAMWPTRCGAPGWPGATSSR